MSDANEGRERASSSIYDVFSGFKVKIGWSKDNINPLKIENGEDGLELGNIYSSGRNSGTTSANPIHTSEKPSRNRSVSLDVSLEEKINMVL